MPFWGELIVGLTIGIGLLGIVIPVLPGGIIVGLSILVWAAIVGGWAWLVFGIAAAVIVIGDVVKYLVAGKHLKSSGVPNTTILVGGIVGIVGFFVVPVLGLFLGFILGAYLAEFARAQNASIAWKGALAAAKAALITMGIELFAALVAAGTWLGGALAF
ncbi:DUF456 family protein [Gordonia amarae]|uniref:DUF456 domain-containing protein n=2 Tax=Gordonia amarae TaxID=36821 RepID=G7GVY7_9ACTN|nr:DUF456 domain-containing protein [Gordonia amarae]MCS3880583.1 uncharacterized protein YqgC (DUF456 family) [Gordonia amarae]QHN18903.1 DUF456 family protein [Gordonia amarae]QHN23378.1 DUF456 family protein [Gordonia amarae]QHN32278.1 DUF456 family protein [Gordonia amarae]QHN41026.1 DUF456 family protein [Gordonia amarae]